MSTVRNLTPEALEEIGRQARRIAVLGEGWQPTEENLRDVVDAVIDTQKESGHRPALGGGGGFPQPLKSTCGAWYNP